MTPDERPRGTHEDAWQRTLRRLAVYSWVLMGAAVLVAIAGSAAVAWILTYVGFPFLTTWLIAAAIILIVPMLVVALRGTSGNT